MKLSRRASWLLIAFALWSWFIWVTLIKNISNDPRSWGVGDAGQHDGGPTAFLAVHVVLAVISIAFGTAIGWLGWRGVRAAPTPVESEPVESEPVESEPVVPEPMESESADERQRIG